MTSPIKTIIMACIVSAGVIYGNPVPGEVQEPQFLYEVLHHLYRWYLDEHDIEKAIPSFTIRVWLRDATPADLDPADHSRIIQLGLPVCNLRILLKKTDYHIPELDIAVKGESFKIVKVSRDPAGALEPDDAVICELSTDDVRNYLFRMRTRRDPLDPALYKPLRETVMRRIKTDDTADITTDTHEIYIAPLSPIANELWIFWKTGRCLIRVASDIEITNPAMWRHEQLAVRIFHIDRRTVVSLAEQPGSNAFLTRDQVGRALYNCIVLGEHQKIKITPDESVN